MIHDTPVLFRWTDSAFGITGWGWVFVFLLLLVIWDIGKNR